MHPARGLAVRQVGELKILDTLIKLVRRDFNEDERLDRQSNLTIQSAKRRLMIPGYYDLPNPLFANAASCDCLLAMLTLENL